MATYLNMTRLPPINNCLTKEFRENIFVGSKEKELEIKKGIRWYDVYLKFRFREYIGGVIYVINRCINFIGEFYTKIQILFSDYFEIRAESSIGSINWLKQVIYIYKHIYTEQNVQNNFNYIDGLLIACITHIIATSNTNITYMNGTKMQKG
jgi:hypothetical protein